MQVNCFEADVDLAEATLRRAAPLEPQRIQRAISHLQALPVFFPAVQKALRLLEDLESTNAHVQQVIWSDQAMAARVLRLANSAYFGFRSEVRTVSLAITLIGRQRISTLLRHFLAGELMKMLWDHKPAAYQIREMSLATAAAARAMAERLLRKDKEEILLAGLLHNLGDLALLSQFRNEYEEMLRLAAQIPRPEAERAVFGVESRLAGKWLLEAWNFPPFFSAVVEHCADPWAVAFPAAPMAVIVLIHTARQLAEARFSDREAEEISLSISRRALSALEIDHQFLADVYLQLPDEIRRLKNALE